MKYEDMGRVSYVSYTDAVSLMKDNNAQAFTLGTTVPASAIMDLASARDIKIVGFRTTSSRPCASSTPATPSW
jgi:TRAP-type uncharacterized transport system substrate-binding protein